MPAVLLGLAIGVLCATVGLLLSALKGPPERDYGLTDGATYDAHARPDRVVGRLIDDVAGLEGDRCLTLGDLWGDDAVEAWRLARPEGARWAG